MGALGSTTSATPDGNDWATIVIVAVVSFVLYCLIFIVRAASKDDSEDEESLAERWAHRIKGRWALPKLGVRSEALPAVCSKVLTQTKDMPLMMPLEHLREKPRAGWSADILAGTSAARLFKAHLLPAARGKPRMLQVLGHDNHGGEDSVLVSVTAGLEITNADGKLFGRLVRRGKGEEYMLEEALGRDPRWAISPNFTEDPSGASMVMTWKPKGKLLATVSKGTRYLNVTNTHGVDAVLVLACALGLMSFEFAPGPSLSSRLHDMAERVEGMAHDMVERVEGVEKQVEGTAAGLLGRLRK